jgi:hypothetical protein
VEIGREELTLGLDQRHKLEKSLDKIALRVQSRFSVPQAASLRNEASQAGSLRYISYDEEPKFELWDPTVSLCALLLKHLRERPYNPYRAGCRLRTSSEDVNHSGRDRSLRVSPKFRSGRPEEKERSMRTINRLGTIVIAFAMLGTVSIAASKAERSNKHFTVAGIVLEIDKNQRTLLVADRASNQTYLIEVPEGATFKIVFGRYMQMREPGLNDVNVSERVEIRCIRGDREHLARLDDGRSAIAVTAAQ